MSQRIVIDPVTRIEGHAKISIYLDDAGNVDGAVEAVLARDPRTRVIPKPFTLGQIRSIILETRV